LFQLQTSGIEFSAINNTDSACQLNPIFITKFGSLSLQEETEGTELSLWWNADLGYFFLQEVAEAAEAFGKSGKRETGKTAGVRKSGKLGGDSKPKTAGEDLETGETGKNVRQTSTSTSTST
jgi:hypothetical protein